MDATIQVTQVGKAKPMFQGIDYHVTPNAMMAIEYGQPILRNFINLTQNLVHRNENGIGELADFPLVGFTHIQQKNILIIA
jgi:hypothetical protein